MVKFLFILLNFFSNVTYHPIIEEEHNYEHVYYTDDYYLVYENNEKIFIKTKNNEWIRELEIDKEFEVNVVEKNIYIFYFKNKEFNCIVYNQEGSVILEKQLFENELINYKIKFDEYFYIVGSLNKYEDEIFVSIKKSSLDLKDGFIIKINKNLEIIKIKTYGGSLDDEFLDFDFLDDSLIIAGKKANLSGGDFGNGGTSSKVSFVTTVNNNLELEDYTIINDTSINLGILCFKDNIYLYSNNYLYKLSPTLEIQFINKFQASVLLLKSAAFNKIIAISKNKLYVYDILTLELLDEVALEIEITKIAAFKNILYSEDLNTYLDLGSFNKRQDLVETIFSKALFIEDQSSKFYDELVYGVYDRKLIYQNSFGINFAVEYKKEVDLKVNVTEGNIYPTGYNLKFTGNGKLNGEVIYNNFAITSDGRYNLKLESNNGEVFEVNFVVAKDQLSFQETEYVNYDKVIKTNETYYINFSYDDELSNINSVIINGIEHKELIINRQEKTISVKMNKITTPGIHTFYLESIEYYENEILRVLNLDYIFIVNALEVAPTIEIYQSKNGEYNINVSDKGTIRYFEISYTYNNEEIVLKYPITSKNIYLEQIPKSSFNVTLSIYYDLGDKVLKKIDLINVEYNNLKSSNIFEIYVSKRNPNLEEFNLSLNSRDLSSVSINDNLIYEKDNKSYFPHIAISFVVAFVCFFSIFKLRKKKQT